MASHIEHQAVAEECTSVVLYFYRDDVVRLFLSAENGMFLPKENVGFHALEAEFTGDVGVGEGWILYAIVALQIKGCIHKVCGQVYIFRASENFLDAGVVVEVHIAIGVGAQEFI